MKKILSITALIIAVAMLNVGCAGRKMKAGPANLVEQSSNISKGALLDRIKSDMPYVGEFADIVIQDSGAADLAKAQSENAEANKTGENQKATTEEIVKPKFEKWEVRFNKEGDLAKHLSSLDEKIRVLCLEAKDLSKDEQVKDEKGKVEEVKDVEASEKDPQALPVVKENIEIRCYSFSKAELEKETKKETPDLFEHSDVSEQRFSIENGSETSRDMVEVQFTISKDGSVISNGSLAIKDKKTTKVFNLKLATENQGNEDAKKDQAAADQVAADAKTAKDKVKEATDKAKDETKKPEGEAGTSPTLELKKELEAKRDESADGAAADAAKPADGIAAPNNVVPPTPPPAAEGAAPEAPDAVAPGTAAPAESPATPPTTDDGAAAKPADGAAAPDAAAPAAEAPTTQPSVQQPTPEQKKAFIGLLKLFGLNTTAKALEESEAQKSEESDSEKSDKK